MQGLYLSRAISSSVGLFQVLWGTHVSETDNVHLYLTKTLDAIMDYQEEVEAQRKKAHK